MKRGYRRATASHRLLPQFIIAGGQKCGTDSLYYYLSRHPAVLPAVVKEVHYFDFNYTRGTDWYRAHFPTKRRATNVSRTTESTVVTGEASPYYLFHPLVPVRVQRLLPDVKIIVMLRNPVERAISHYYHSRALGHEDCSLEEAIECEAARLANARAGADGEVPEASFEYQHYSYASRGIYVDQLERWRGRFNPEQVLVLSSAALFSDPEAGTQRVLDFLELPPTQESEFPIVGGRDYPDASPAVRARLSEYFAPHNRRLWKLLGEDFGW